MFETCIVLHACVGLLEGVCHSGTLSWEEKRRKKEESKQVQLKENSFQSSTITEAGSKPLEISPWLPITFLFLCRSLESSYMCHKLHESKLHKLHGTTLVL